MIDVNQATAVGSASGVDLSAYTTDEITRLHQYNNQGVRDNEARSSRIQEEHVWGNAVHRVVAEGITPEQAVDEAIARIKQILSE